MDVENVYLRSGSGHIVAGGLLCLCLAAGQGWCESPQPDGHASVTLLSNVDSVRAGHTFTIGVMTRIKPKWYIPWTSSGDAGVGTTLSLTLPEGFSAGQPLWPLPTIFTQPGGLVGYGYDKAVMVMAPIKTPTTLPAKSKIRITAELNYMACKEFYTPGLATAQITLPVTTQPAPTHRRQFEKWKALLPVDAEKSPVVENAEVTATPKVSDVLDVRIVIDWKKRVRDVAVFAPSAAGLEIDRWGISANTAGRRSQIAFSIKLLKGHRPDRKSLKVLVVLTDEQGARYGVNISVPMTLTSQK